MLGKHLGLKKQSRLSKTRYFKQHHEEKMEQLEIQKLAQLRNAIIKEYEKLRDYKLNESALMKEVDHARALHRIIVRLDGILKEHVAFK